MKCDLCDQGNCDELLDFHNGEYYIEESDDK